MFAAMLGIFTLTVAFCLGAFFLGEKRGTVRLDRNFYFLVRPCEDSTSAAVVGEVYASGGAGVRDGQEVILACYPTASDARRVCSLLEQRGEEVYVVARTAESFTLRGRNAALLSEVQGNADTMLSCITLLYGAANDLERGGGQAAARAATEGVCASIGGLEEGNTQPVFTAWNRELYALRREGESLDGILFAKDLRALQIRLALALIGMKNRF